MIQMQKNYITTFICYIICHLKMQKQPASRESPTANSSPSHDRPPLDSRPFRPSVGAAMADDDYHVTFFDDAVPPRPAPATNTAASAFVVMPSSRQQAARQFPTPRSVAVAPETGKKKGAS